MQAGREFAGKNLSKTDPYHVERMDKTAGKIIIEGNAAAALGAVYGGATVCAWYPITPSSSVAEAFQKYAAKLKGFHVLPIYGGAEFGRQAQALDGGARRLAQMRSWL